MESVIEAADRIRRLEVQGATSVAMAAVRALVDLIMASEAEDRDAALVEVAEARGILFAARETEPLMRNAIRFIESRVRGAGWGTMEELRPLARGLSDELFGALRDAGRRIAEVGSRRISQGDRILTHCHSSVVDGVFEMAKRQGVDFEVIVTETRPVYQGRITARRLLDAEIRTTMIVDSAVRSLIRRVNVVMVGADAITSEGNVVNKIGTSLIALSAREARVPFYVATELLKFDPATIRGDYEAIEERPPSEIWPDAPAGLTILNPAFDVTRRDHIHGIICEAGVIPPHSVVDEVRRHYPWVLEYPSSSS